MPRTCCSDTHTPAIDPHPGSSLSLDPSTNPRLQYPGVLYHLSFWYPATKLPLRIAVFYSFGVFSGTASGFLAYAISFMDGLHGISGWQWMFILEGIPAICLGVAAWFWLPNWPQTAPFLSATEKDTLLSSLPTTQPTGASKTWVASQAAALLADPTFATFNLLWMFHSIGGWGISLVLPTVIYELGLQGSAVSQLMTMPTYAFGCAFMCFFGWLIHRGRLGPWTVSMALEVVICVCYVVLLTVDQPVVKYVFVTLATACVACVYPLMWPERIRAARGTTGAGLGIGITNVSTVLMNDGGCSSIPYHVPRVCLSHSEPCLSGVESKPMAKFANHAWYCPRQACAQLAGIVGPQVYQSRFGPQYTVSYSVSIAMLSGAVTMMGASWFFVARRDRREQLANGGGIGEQSSPDGTA